MSGQADLGTAAMAASPALVADVDALAAITPFAVELRYDPDFWPERAAAEGALAAAEAIRSQVGGLLPPEARP